MIQGSGGSFLTLSLACFLLVDLRFFEDVPFIVLVEVVPLDWNGDSFLRVEVNIVVAAVSRKDEAVALKNGDRFLSFPPDNLIIHNITQLVKKKLHNFV